VVTVVVGVGYIGSRLVQELLYQGREVVGVDNLFSSDRRAIDAFRQLPGFRFVEGSILDPSVLDAALTGTGDVDALFLLAAQSSGHPDAAPPELTELVNLQGPRLVLDRLARQRFSAPIVFASSSRVYGSPLPPVVSENTPYGRFTDLSHLSKCYVEKLLEMYAWRDRLTCASVRIGLTYGIAPVMKTDRRFMTAPNLFCWQVARGDKVTVRSTEAVGLAHVEDVARGLLLVGDRSTEPGYDVFNLAPQVATIGEIARAVVELAEARELAPIDVELVGPGLVEEPSPVIASRLTDLGFTARRSLRDGLAETLDHFLVHGQ
jgi:UDP-glucose 4-epimerase